MGVPLEEIELLGGGVETGSPAAGAYALNMIHRQGAWEVRKGFGQLAQYDTSMSTNPIIGASVSAMPNCFGATSFELICTP